MRTIGASEAKDILESLLDGVERGQEIEITRHGRVVARLVPAMRRLDQNQARAAFQRIRERAKLLKLAHPDSPAFDWEEFKKMRDEGRA